MKNEKGFSLVELLVVVIIIAIIAAIAIPNLLASRRAANESSAIGSLRTIHGAQATYFATTGNNSTYGDLASLLGANLIDAQVGSGTKSGYTLATTPTDPSGAAPAQFCITAVPLVATGATATGIRSFAVGTPGVISGGATAPACSAGIVSGGTVIQ